MKILTALFDKSNTENFTIEFPTFGGVKTLLGNALTSRARSANLAPWLMRL
jgi:hypothetical protein